MSIEIKVPAMGESVTEATVARWFKKEGDAVKRDEPLLELETDKVTVEVPAPADGAIESIAVKEGDTVQVGTILGAIAEGKIGNASAPKAAAPKPAAAPAPKPAAPPAPKPVAAAQPQMPSVRRIAEETGLNPASVSGSGKDGRVVKGDMLAALEARARAPQPVHVPTGPRANEAREERVTMSRLRRTIAMRLKESQNTAAQLTTFNEVDMSHVMKLRAEYKESFEKKHGVRLGFMGFFVKACIAALKELPNVNAELEGDDIIYKNYYDIGVAVSTEKGLVVPVVRDADTIEHCRDRSRDQRFRTARARRQAEDRRIAGRHVHDLQWRRVRLADVHADPQHAAIGHSGHAQDPAAPRRHRQQGGNPPDDVSGALLRSPPGRWTRGGDVSRAREGKPRRPAAVVVGYLVYLPHVGRSANEVSRVGGGVAAHAGPPHPIRLRGLRRFDGSTSPQRGR